MTTNSVWYELRDAVFCKEFSRASDLLVANPELIDLRNGIGETVLHFLAVENDLEGVQWLFSRGFSVNPTTEFGDPMLFEVASLGYQELIIWLIEHGANPLVTNGDGQNIFEYLRERFPIDPAEENASTRMTTFLIANVPPLRNLNTAACGSEPDI